MLSENNTWKSKCFLALTRRKPQLIGDLNESKLARVLGFVDLTSLAIGATLGLGVYILAGEVAANNAGPAVTISFLVAAIASVFAGLCYAEFAARVPKAGSAYIYCYVTVGEFTAFLIGWNLILEYAIGSAAMAKGLSNYINLLTGNIIQNALLDLMPISVPFLAPYPDFLALSIVLILTMLLAWGVKESSTVNTIFTVTNLLTVTLVIVVGGFNADPSLWAIKKDDIPPGVNGGDGGFLPFGWSGVFSGAAACFFGFVGFDIIATTGEEAKNPKKNIPLAIATSLLIIFLAYFGIGTVLTMMVPYYEQNRDAPLPYAFSRKELPVMAWSISIGAICGMCTGLLGGMLPLPRILFAMGEDGLLFKCFSNVNEYTKTPIIATLISGLLAGIMSGIFDLTQLMEMMSIGTLLAYCIVALCILILRYSEDANVSEQSSSILQNSTSTELPTEKLCGGLWYFFRRAFNLNKLKYPTSCSRNVALYSLFSFSLSIFLLFCVLIYGGEIMNNHIQSYFLSVFSAICILSFVVLMRQPQANVSLHFKVPLVPLIPLCSITMNIYLMLALNINTWIRFVIWLIIGFIIYLFYSLSHSIEGKKIEF